jgi:excisionase family DNA binding protein
MPEIPDTPSPGEDPWLTVQQVSEELKIHPATVRAWIRQGRLQAARVGKGFRVRRSEVDRAIGAVTSPASAQDQLRSKNEPEAAGSPRPAPRRIADHIMTVTSAPERGQ